jgi:hypothetical protein
MPIDNLGENQEMPGGEAHTALVQSGFRRTTGTEFETKYS